MPVLKIRNQQNRILEMHVEEIISIDGEPWRGMPVSGQGEEAADVREWMAHLTGRVDEIERILLPQLTFGQVAFEAGNGSGGIGGEMPAIPTPAQHDIDEP